MPVTSTIASTLVSTVALTTVGNDLAPRCADLVVVVVAVGVYGCTAIFWLWSVVDECLDLVPSLFATDSAVDHLGVAIDGNRDLQLKPARG